MGAAFGFLERRRIDLDGGDARAGVEQSERHHLAEAAPGAGDDRDLSIKRSGHDYSSFDGDAALLDRSAELFAVPASRRPSARPATNSRSLARRPCLRRQETLAPRNAGRLHGRPAPPIFKLPFRSSLMTLSASPTRRAERRGDLHTGTATLMPKAPAVWLGENTSLSFEQIAQLCNLHPLEVKAIADGDAAQGIKGLDPILTGQLTRDEITAAEADPNHKLHIADPKVRLPEAKPKKGPRYTPVSRRQDRPNAILWLVRNHPELKDSAIMRL